MGTFQHEIFCDFYEATALQRESLVSSVRTSKKDKKLPQTDRREIEMSS